MIQPEVYERDKKAKFDKTCAGPQAYGTPGVRQRDPRLLREDLFNDARLKVFKGGEEFHVSECQVLVEAIVLGVINLWSVVVGVGPRIELDCTALPPMDGPTKAKLKE